MKKLLLLIFQLLLVTYVHAATYSSVSGGGDWLTPGSWSGGGPPTSGASTSNMNVIIINAGHTITISGDLIALSNVVIQVYGTLRMDDNGGLPPTYANLNLTGSNSGVIVYAGGKIDENSILDFNLNIRVNGVTVWNGSTIGDYTATSTVTFPSTGVYNPLPIELSSWSVIPSNDKHTAHWTTHSEWNNSFFTIEESLNGLEFYELATVKAIGNSTTTQKYSYSFVPKSNESLMYYRLKQTDLDGGFTYSAVVELYNSNTAGQLEVFPNPVVGNEITVANYGTNEIVNISLFNSQTGQLAIGKDITATIESSNFKLNIPESFVAGVYLLIIQYSNGTDSKQLIINR